MNIPDKLKFFLSVIEQRAAREGYGINVTYRDDSDYVRDYFIQVGHQVFQLWHNLKSTDSVPYGWKEYNGF